MSDDGVAVFAAETDPEYAPIEAHRELARERRRLARAERDEAEGEEPPVEGWDDSSGGDGSEFRTDGVPTPDDLFGSRTVHTSETK